MKENQLYTKHDDYELEYALDVHGYFAIEDIDTILAAVHGENNEFEWYWIILLKDGTIGLLQGGCDYTGWDCQSDLTWLTADTPEKCVELVYLESESRPIKMLLNEQLQG